MTYINPPAFGQQPQAAYLQAEQPQEPAPLPTLYDHAVIRELTDGKYVIKIMDGSIVRRDIDEQFTDFASHNSMPLVVPVGEIWIDRSLNQKEYPYFIANAEAVEAARVAGKGKQAARRAGDRVETKLRQQDPVIKRMLTMPPKLQMERVIRETLGEVGTVPVYLVDGYMVRGVFDIDFTEGGHDLEVDWMGKNPMVWIDDALPESDRPYVKFHEIYEHQQMEQGMNYDDAHADASYKEQYYRQHPDELNLADLGFIKSGNLD